LLAHALRSSEEIIRQFPKCRVVANTFRFDYEQGIRYFTTLYTEGELQQSHEYRLEQILDKVGSGDCFMAGLIYGNLQQWDAQQVIEFATAAAFKKLFIKGDATTSSVEEIRLAFTQYA
jgi:2-dehydro-3-deoxygluconokinase